MIAKSAEGIAQRVNDTVAALRDKRVFIGFFRDNKFYARSVFSAMGM